jgi:hypothetical protein
LSIVIGIHAYTLMEHLIGLTRTRVTIYSVKIDAIFIHPIIIYFVPQEKKSTFYNPKRVNYTKFFFKYHSFITLVVRV